MKVYIGFLIFCVTISSQVFSQISENITVLANWDGEDVPFNGSAKYNDVWGFVVNGEEYGCIGSTLGTHLFSLPSNNEIENIGFVAGKFQGAVVHRDFAFYEGYLYAVCDQGSSSLQVIDVSGLPSSINIVLDDTTNVTTAHNVTVDEIGKKLYVSGPEGFALKVFDISSSPENPELVNDFNEVEYVHDVFARDNIAYLSAGNQGLFIFDFSIPDAPEIISSIDGYPDEGYNHSGWLSSDGNYFAFADETPSKRMKIIDVSDPTDLQVVSLFNSGLNENTMPHNLEWIGDLIFVSHYYDGLQVFDVSDVAHPEVCAFYDTYQEEDINGRGAWGVHVMPSGRILISDRQTGFYLFGMKTKFAESEGVWLYPNPMEEQFCINLREVDYMKVRFQVYDSSGKLLKDETHEELDQVNKDYLINTSDFSGGVYHLRLILNDTEVRLRSFIVLE